MAFEKPMPIEIEDDAFGVLNSTFLEIEASLVVDELQIIWSRTSYD